MPCSLLPTVLWTLPMSNHTHKSSCSNKTRVRCAQVIRRLASACNDAASVRCLLPGDGLHLHTAGCVRSEATRIRIFEQIATDYSKGIFLHIFELTATHSLSKRLWSHYAPSCCPPSKWDSRRMESGVWQIVEWVRGSGQVQGEDREEVPFGRINLSTSRTVTLHCTLTSTPTTTTWPYSSVQALHPPLAFIKL